MDEVLTITAITAGAYVGTNLDNLLLLVTFHSRYKDQSSAVTAAYVAVMILVGALGFLIGKGGNLIPIDYLGLLGIIPMLIGVWALLQLLRRPPQKQKSETVTSFGIKAVFLAVFMTQLSNGTDSIITFSILFADSGDTPDLVIVLAFFGMVCLFAWLAFYLLKHRKTSDILQRYGHYATPFILILVGYYILSNTATDLMPG
jgi:cadmium resistance protein CadD (predicted permease)